MYSSVTGNTFTSLNVYQDNRMSVRTITSCKSNSTQPLVTWRKSIIERRDTRVFSGSLSPRYNLSTLIRGAADVTGRLYVSLQSEYTVSLSRYVIFRRDSRLWRSDVVHDISDRYMSFTDTGSWNNRWTAIMSLIRIFRKMCYMCYMYKKKHKDKRSNLTQSNLWWNCHRKYDNSRMENYI